MSTSTSNTTRSKLPRLTDAVYWDYIASWAVKHSDGCSGVADIYVQACWEHDYHYRYGRTVQRAPISRSAADRRFRQVVQALSPAGLLSPVSWWRWAGLRLFGGRAWRGHRNREIR